MNIQTHILALEANIHTLQCALDESYTKHINTIVTNQTYFNAIQHAYQEEIKKYEHIISTQKNIIQDLQTQLEQKKEQPKTKTCRKKGGGRKKGSKNKVYPTLHTLIVVSDTSDTSDTEEEILLSDTTESDVSVSEEEDYVEEALILQSISSTATDCKQYLIQNLTTVCNCEQTKRHIASFTFVSINQEIEIYALDVSSNKGSATFVIAHTCLFPLFAMNKKNIARYLAAIVRKNDTAKEHIFLAQTKKNTTWLLDKEGLILAANKSKWTNRSSGNTAAFDTELETYVTFLTSTVADMCTS